jgi:DUF1680 family protein
MSNGIPHWRVTVRVNGIKKKCRKVDSHFFTIATIPWQEKDTIDLSMWSDKARDYVASNMKSVNGKVMLDFNYSEVGDHFYTVQLFDSRHFRHEVVSPVIAELA